MICPSCKKDYSHRDKVNYACIIVYGKCLNCLDNKYILLSNTQVMFLIYVFMCLLVFGIGVSLK